MSEIMEITLVLVFSISIYTLIIVGIICCKMPEKSDMKVLHEQMYEISKQQNDLSLKIKSIEKNQVNQRNEKI